jgi:hypothetical protein
MAWDREECRKFFTKHGVRLRNEDVKFCRRVGPKGEKARPLVVGFYGYAARNAVLRVDWKEAAPNMSVGPDLTKKQREEEAQIWKDMERKNVNRTEEERAKNLVWRLVGPKGERRLILSTERSNGAGAGTSARGRGAPAARRGGQRTGTPRAGASRQTEAGGTRSSMQGPRLLEVIRDDQPFRPRIGSKRGREEPQEEAEMEEDEETREPPTKH